MATYAPISSTARKNATENHPAPAVLLFHGYQNDKDTSSSYAIELARRGIVVMCLDTYGHGDTTVGMAARGYTARKLPGWDAEVAGPERFLVMMSFSTNDFYTLEGVQESGMDSTMGGRLALDVLLALPFVDADNIGFSGHSMGTWASWSMAAYYPAHKAVVLQCGELFPQSYYDAETVKFNNVLLLQAKYDEFGMFMDYTLSTDGLLLNPAALSRFCPAGRAHRLGHDLRRFCRWHGAAHAAFGKCQPPPDHAEPRGHRRDSGMVCKGV